MTAGHWQPAGKGRRRIGWGAALLVQALALGVWWTGFGKVLPGHREEARTMTVRLVTAKSRIAPGDPPDLRAPPPVGKRPALPPVPAPILVAVPEVSITAAPPTTSIQTVAASASAASSPAPLGTGRTTLNLALPKAGAASDARLQMADQIRNDPRAHSERRSVEWAIADAAGTLPVEVGESTSGSGSKIVRQGSKCVRVYENRVAALNPTDDRLKDAPSMAGKCFSK
jgi:hypothetical protein